MKWSWAGKYVGEVLAQRALVLIPHITTTQLTKKELA